MTRALDALDALVGGIVAALLAVALVLATLGIVGRYALSGVNLDWTGEVVIFVIIWAILLSLSRVERRAAHVRVDFLFDKLPDRARRVALLVAFAMGLVLSVLFVWAGWTVVAEAIQWDERTPSTLRVPLWIYYAALSSAFALNIVVLLERVIHVMRGAERPEHSLSD